MIKPSTTLMGPYAEQVTNLQPALHGMLWTVLHCQADVDDVLQEINLALWKRADDYDPQRDFRRWAFGVARLQLLAFHKRQARNKRITFDLDLIKVMIAEEIEDPYFTRPRQGALRNCLDRLPQARRELVASRYHRGCSVNTLARDSGKSPKAISETLRRIRSLLKNCIEGKLRSEGDVQ